MYGNEENDVARTEQWHNFLALKGGTLDFGKLTMHHGRHHHDRCVERRLVSTWTW